MTRYSSFWNKWSDIQIGLVRFDEARRTCQQTIDIAQKCLDADPESSVYLTNLERAKERMLRIKFTQLFTENQTGEKEAELAAYCNDLVNSAPEIQSSPP